MVLYEILSSVYSDDTQQIEVLMGIKDVLEIDVPSTILPGTPVDEQRWIRRIETSFTGAELEVRSSLTTPFGPGSSEVELQDVSRFPNSGSLTINRDGASSEIVTYTSRDVESNKLIGVSNPINWHLEGELVYPSVDVDFLGTYELELRPFGTWEGRGPVRYGRTQVLLNGTVTLRENVDFTVVNDFVGNTCTRTRLRFMQGGQPRRFSTSDFLDVVYEFFVQEITSIKIYTAPSQVTSVNVYETGTVGMAFGTLRDIERGVTPAGNYRITPPFSNTILPPTPVKVVVPDVHLPVNIFITEEIDVTTVDIPISDASCFPQVGTLRDATDDQENRKVFIGGDTISYTRVDKVLNKLIGVSGITEIHPKDSEVFYDGARYTRDVVKNAFNTSPLGGQVDTLAVDTGGRYLRMKSKAGITSNFNLQPGTYQLFYIGFRDDIDRGLHSDITTSTPFENKDLTFERYRDIINRQEIAKDLLGQTVSRRTVLISTNPTDVTFNVP